MLRKFHFQSNIKIVVFIPNECKSENFLMKKMFEILLTLAAISIHPTEGARCPPMDVITPCVCESDPSEYYIHPMFNIRCGGIDDYDLVQIFEDASRSLYGSEDKFFNEFVLNNTAIKHLPPNVFSDLTFRVIKLDGAYSLSYISPHAFGTSTPFIGNSKLNSNKLIHFSLKYY